MGLLHLHAKFHKDRMKTVACETKRKSCPQEEQEQQEHQDE